MYRVPLEWTDGAAALCCELTLSQWLSGKSAGGGGRRAGSAQCSEAKILV